MECCIAVDIGTTNMKVVAFNLEGDSLARHDVAYAISHPQADWSEQDPDVITRALLTALKRVVAQVEAYEIKAISFSSAMHSLMALDHNGNPLTPLIIWADNRSDKEALKLRESPLAQQIYAQTGTPLHPMSPLCKLMWLKANASDVFLKAAKFVSIKEYIFAQLFGVYVVDYGIASATGLFNTAELTWSELALKTAGIAEDQFSKPVSPYTCFRKPKLSELDIGLDVDWVIGGSDGCLANLGSDAIRPGQAAITIGTSGAIRMIAKRPFTDLQQRTFSYVLDENHFVLGGSVNNGGNALQWFKDQFTHEEHYENLMNMAREIPAGSRGLICLPYFLGERAPHWNASARGVYFGVNHSHGPAHFLRATLEGATFGLLSIAGILEEIAGPMDLIYANGGIVSNDVWMQIISDVFNKKVIVAANSESSCLGALKIALKAIGVCTDIENIKLKPTLTQAYLPDPRRHETYKKSFDIFKNLYPQLKDSFDAISKLQREECHSSSLP